MTEELKTTFHTIKWYINVISSFPVSPRKVNTTPTSWAYRHMKETTYLHSKDTKYDEKCATNEHNIANRTERGQKCLNY